MRYTLASLLTLACLCGWSQTKNHIDSIYRRLQQASHQKDSNFLKALNNYSRVIRFDSNATALAYAKEAIAIAKQTKDDYWLAHGYASAGMTYDYKGDLRNGIAYIDSAISIFEQQKRYDRLATLLGIKGGLLLGQGKYAEAAEMQFRSIELAEKTDNLIEQAKGYGDIAILFFYISMYDESLKEFTNALNKFRQLKDTASVALCYEYIGHNYIALKNYPDARTSFDTSIMFYSAINRANAIASVMGSRAIAMAYMGEVRQALAIEKQTLQSAITADKKSLISLSYSKAAKIILIGLDSIQNNEFSLPSAIEYAEKGWQVSKETGRIFGQTYAMEVLAALYDRNGDYAKAYRIQKEYSRIRDSLANSNKVHEVAIKTAQFENQKEQAVLTATHVAELRQQKTTRYFLIGGSILVLLSASLIFWSYSRRKDAQTRQQEAELKAQVADTENKILRLQMNPHFIFNSLNSISDYIRKNDIEEADAYLARFATIMRITLENSELKEITLAEELQALELYIQLEAKRLKNKLTYSLDIEDDIETTNILVPSMLLQPIVENSIWHGIAKKQGDGHITISFSKKGGALICRVEDNGVGKVNSQQTPAGNEKKSLGMKITKARIEMLGKQKGVDSGLFVTEKPGGFITTLQLPLETVF